MRNKIKIDFKDFWHADTDEAKRANPLFKVLSRRFDLELSDDPDFLVYSCFGSEYLRYDCTRIFFTGENRRPDFRLCDYAFSFDYPVTERHFRYPIYALSTSLDRDVLVTPRDVDAVLAEKTRFCAFVYSNAQARHRIKFLDKLGKYKPVDCGGKVRNNLGYRVADKVAFLRAYKFCIAFENSSWPGYTTEKLPEAMMAGSVGIYWGNPLVALDFNPRAFINAHDYRSLDELVDFVVETDRSDALYRQYLLEPAFSGNEVNEFIRDDAVLDRFNKIFSSQRQPVARTTYARMISLWREPARRWRRLRRAGASSR